MDKNLTAILIRAYDYKDNDKRAELFSVEEGIVTVTMRGIKKANAKLKFACQPFSFCIYELSEHNKNYVVTGATTVEDMFALTKDTDVYFCACAVMEIVKSVGASISCGELFVVVLKTLKAMLYGNNASPYLILAKYVQKVLSMSGFARTRVIAEPDLSTTNGMLSYIATKYLDEVAKISADNNLAMDCAVDELIRFEKLYETSLNAVKFIKQL
ncbi:MAG: DNA repair protein RecO [Clostridia bacterium]|nr:DNA repair protein RecO [Clostridia bacterium]